MSRRSHQRVAFLFPGQGSQHQGMGAGLFEDPELATLAKRCSEFAQIDLEHLLLRASDEELTLTTNAQPALVFMGIALAKLLAREGIIPVAAAGHSVGEYAALCVAEAISPEEAILAVVNRGQVMAEASPPGESSMQAVLGISLEQVQQALENIEDVWAANLNTPTQTVIGGTVKALELAETELLAAGARRVISLRVAAAFHTPLMEPAGERLQGILSQLKWCSPKFSVASNLTGRIYQPTDDILTALRLQLSSPVKWAECVGQIVNEGVAEFLELGPRRALSGMMRELAPGVPAIPLSTPEAVAKYSEASC